MRLLGKNSQLRTYRKSLSNRQRRVVGVVLKSSTDAASCEAPDLNFDCGAISTRFPASTRLHTSIPSSKMPFRGPKGQPTRRARARKEEFYEEDKQNSNCSCAAHTGSQSQCQCNSSPSLLRACATGKYYSGFRLLGGKRQLGAN